MSVDRLSEGLAIVIRLLRIWSAARTVDANPMPRMTEALTPVTVSPEFVPACASLFTLTEALLGRPLLPERCYSAALSRDELAVMLVLRHAPGAGSIETTRAVPHGMPEGLRWAAFAVLRILGDSRLATPPDSEVIPSFCPFAAQAAA